VTFSMYGADAGAGVSSTHNDGYRFTDATGAVSGLTSSFRSLNTTAGARGTFDASRGLDLNADQRLWFGLDASYRHLSTDFGATVGSTKTNLFTLAGSANYSIGSFYLNGRGAVDVGSVDLTNAATGGSGDSGQHGYSFELRGGRLFTL